MEVVTCLKRLEKNNPNFFKQLRADLSTPLEIPDYLVEDWFMLQMARLCRNHKQVVVKFKAALKQHGGDKLSLLDKLRPTEVENIIENGPKQLAIKTDADAAFFRNLGAILEIDADLPPFVVVLWHFITYVLEVQLPAIWQAIRQSRVQLGGADESFPRTVAGAASQIWGVVRFGYQGIRSAYGEIKFVIQCFAFIATAHYASTFYGQPLLEDEIVQAINQTTISSIEGAPTLNSTIEEIRGLQRFFIDFELPSLNSNLVFIGSASFAALNMAFPSQRATVFPGSEVYTTNAPITNLAVFTRVTAASVAHATALSFQVNTFESGLNNVFRHFLTEATTPGGDGVTPTSCPVLTPKFIGTEGMPTASNIPNLVRTGERLANIIKLYEEREYIINALNKYAKFKPTDTESFELTLEANVLERLKTKVKDHLSPESHTYQKIESMTPNTAITFNLNSDFNTGQPSLSGRRFLSGEKFNVLTLLLRGNDREFDADEYNDGQFLFDVVMTQFMWNIYTVDSTLDPTQIPSGPRSWNPTQQPSLPPPTAPAPTPTEPPSLAPTPSFSGENIGVPRPPPTILLNSIPAPGFSSGFQDFTTAPGSSPYSNSNAAPMPESSRRPTLVLNDAGKAIKNFYEFSQGGDTILDTNLFEMTVETPENAVDKYATDGKYIDRGNHGIAKKPYIDFKEMWGKSAAKENVHTFREIIIENAQGTLERSRVVGTADEVWEQAPSVIKKYMKDNPGKSLLIELDDETLKGATFELCNTLNSSMTDWKRKVGNWAALDFKAAFTFDCPKNDLDKMNGDIKLMRINKDNFDKWKTRESPNAALLGVIVVVVDLFASAVIVKFTSGPTKLTPARYGICWRLLGTAASLFSMALVQAGLRIPGNIIGSRISTPVQETIGLDVFNPLFTGWAMFSTVHYIKLQVRGRIASYFLEDGSTDYMPTIKEIEKATVKELKKHLRNVLTITDKDGLAELNQTPQNINPTTGDPKKDVMITWLKNCGVRWPSQSKTWIWKNPAKNSIITKFNEQYRGLSGEFKSLNYQQLANYAALGSIPLAIFAKSAIEDYVETSSRMFVDAV